MSNADDKRQRDGVRFDNNKISALWSSELRRSHSILEGVMALLSPGARQELSAILEILAVDGNSQELHSVRQQALQLVTEVCRQDIPDETTQYGSERRTGDRRQRDRRQHSRNHGSPWSTEDIRILQALAEQNVPVRRIALKLGRASVAVESKAKEIGVPLRLIKILRS